MPQRLRDMVGSLVLALACWCACVSAMAGQVSHGPTEQRLLRKMIGQMVMVGFVGSTPRDEGYRIVVEQAEAGTITGVMYLKRNIDSLDGVRVLNAGLKSASQTPFLIALDQEGGKIERLTTAVGFREIPSAAAVAGSMTDAEAEKLYLKLASRLSELGFNLNLAPVADLNVNPDNPIIGRLGRSFSSHPKKVAAYARAFVRAHRAAGVLTSLKHFPGHGSSRRDSHKGTADVTKTWSEAELIPFKTLIDTGDADLIMSSHVVNGVLSPAVSTPSSLSRPIITDLLRGTLRFAGVVISDDMQMQAITDSFQLADAVREAVLAGTDILVFANDKHPDPRIPDKVADILVEEAGRNPEMLACIREAYDRVTALKRKLKMDRQGQGQQRDLFGTRLP